MPTYWQIAAGSDQRDYSDLFLKYGIAFAGGGLEKVNVGDIMVLKRGITAIKAVGTVVERDGRCGGCGDKDWLLDIDGWELLEYRYVEWRKPNEPIRVSGLVMGALKGLHIKELTDIADNILDIDPVEPEPEPPSTEKVNDEDILKFLVQQGTRPSSSDEITSTISKIRLLADYYYYQYGYPWSDIGEHEIRTFLVVPLLLALGWSEQQIKVEFRKIDIACFRRPCKSNNREEWEKECVAIIETKRFGAGLDYAHEQAKTYSKDFPNCQAVITTNGYCYKVYLRDQCDKFQEMPSAYINLLRPRDKYPLDPNSKVKGALEAIKWLLPSNLITTPKEPAH